MNNKKAIIWITIFLILTGSSSITYFFLRNDVESHSYGKRNASYTYFYRGQYVDISEINEEFIAEKESPAFPMLTSDNWKTYSDEFTHFYDNTLPYRNMLIRINSSIDYYLFGEVSNKNVIQGENNWLFYKASMESATGMQLFTEEQLEKIAQNLTLAKRVLESQGIEFVLFIAPDKETIYSEFLPSPYQNSPEMTSVEQLITYLGENTDIKVVFPKEELLNFKQENPDIVLYHKLDTHWNNAGAYIGAAALADSLGLSLPDLQSASLETHTFSTGDLTNMLGMPLDNVDTDYYISNYGEQTTTLESFGYSTDIMYQNDTADKTLFVCRDSFSSALAPFISTLFNKSCFVFPPVGKFDQKEMFTYAPDVFVLEKVQRELPLLEYFHISYINSEVESTISGKNIVISPSVSSSDLNHVSIVRKNDTGDTQSLQTLKPLHSQISIRADKNETGEITVCIYEDELGKNLIEKAVISY